MVAKLKINFFIVYFILRKVINIVKSLIIIKWKNKEIFSGFFKYM